MTVAEMSNEFDILFNNVNSDKAPGLDEYEKSVLLTKAQNEIVKNYFNAKGNKYEQGFDGNQKRQIDFSSIIKTSHLVHLLEKPVIDSRSLVYRFPPELLCVINESFVDANGVRYSIVPLSYEEYTRVLMKPYAYPPKKCMWRLISEPAPTGSGEWSAVLYNDSKRELQVSRWEYMNYTQKPIQVRLTYKLETSTAGYDSIKKSYPAPVIKEEAHKTCIDITVPVGNTGESAGSSTSYSLLYCNEYLTDTSAAASAGSLSKQGYMYLDIPKVWAGQLKMSGVTADGTTTLTYNLLFDAQGESNKVELIGRTTNRKVEDGEDSSDGGMCDLCHSTYMCRYVKKPQPIILIDLDTDDYTVSIEGRTAVTECELPEELHPEIVQRAVEIAKVLYGGEAEGKNEAAEVMEIGKRSE